MAALKTMISDCIKIAQVVARLAKIGLRVVVHLEETIKRDRFEFISGEYVGGRDGGDDDGVPTRLGVHLL
jgi:hypothetical protein